MSEFFEVLDELDEILIKTNRKVEVPMPDANTQIAPYPQELDDLIKSFRLTTKPKWRFILEHLDRGQGSEGLTLSIFITEPDAYHPEQLRSVVHYFPIPPAAYDYRSWRRWLLDRILEVNLHETCEGFTVAGVKPYAPSHGPGNDPYMIREVGTELDQKTSFRGEVKE